MFFIKKGQGAIEFLVLIGFVLIFFVTFLGVIQNNMNEKNKEKEKLLLQNIALSVRDEISLASESSEGYFRVFKIPQNVLGKEYEVGIIEDFVNVSMGNMIFFYKIPEVNGSIQKGQNNITKQNGTVFIN
ncbi:MAG: hypothetical protein KKF48_00310 [Nanoarchaeota archaeon]|nr:hypothetical protein [Nanoarchaeota archaeon]MBU1027467.1 hypothetical protein [Nanoarchaeota archaeon]